MTTPSISFGIENWVGACDSDATTVTLAALRIEAGSRRNQNCLTEVDDSIARTVRQQIYVPVLPLVHWLLINWWRLRWEPRRRTHDWRATHAMGSIGEGYAWPPIEFSSDGEFIHIHLSSERRRDVAGIRYLSSAAIEIPAIEFEEAVDRLVAQTRARLVACQKEIQNLDEMVAELTEERNDPTLSRANRLQSYAGIDPGDAQEGWLGQADELSRVTGPSSIYEVMAILPDLKNDLSVAGARIDYIRNSAHKIDLSWTGPAPPPAKRTELPWQKGVRLARNLRKRLGIDTPQFKTSELSNRLGVKLPIADTPSTSLLAGGFRGHKNARTSIVVPTPRLDHQRFSLARLIGCALLLPLQDRLLPVSGARTAIQKSERAFAQELLCPWRELDEFTDKYGVEEDGVAKAADYFEVAESVVLSTLVNRHKLSRDRLLER